MSGFPITIDGVPSGSPSLGDINGDGKNEIVFAFQTANGPSGSSQIRAIDGEGLIVHQSSSLPGSVYSYPLLLDIDQDYTDEILIIISDPSYFLKIFSYGNPEPIRSIGVGETALGGLAGGDINKDGKKEILIYTIEGTLRVLNAEGELLWMKQGLTHNLNHQTPAIVDLNNDGESEIILGTGRSQQSTSDSPFIHVWDAEGNLLWTKPIESHLGSLTTPAVDNIDDDIEHPELIFNMLGSSYASIPARIRIYAYNGTLLLEKLLPQSYMVHDAVLGDIDGNGIKDIVFSLDNRLYAIDSHDGLLLQGWPKVFQKGYFQATTPVIKDLDADCLNEVVYTINNGDLNGLVNLWEAGLETVSSGWPMFKHDKRHTGNYIPNNGSLDCDRDGNPNLDDLCPFINDQELLDSDGDGYSPGCQDEHGRPYFGFWDCDDDIQNDPASCEPGCPASKENCDAVITQDSDCSGCAVCTHPKMSELCGDGRDNDCDLGVDYEDADCITCSDANYELGCTAQDLCSIQACYGSAAKGICTPCDLNLDEHINLFDLVLCSTNFIGCRSDNDCSQGQRCNPMCTDGPEIFVGTCVPR